MDQIKFTQTIVAIAFAALLSISNQANAFEHFPGQIIFQAGGFTSTQGQAQDIGIQTLVGDLFTVDNGHTYNGVLGLGYYVTGSDDKDISSEFGINAFYLFKTQVRGYILQEEQFANLGYEYSISHLPIYAAMKNTFKADTGKYAVTLDLGAGPNFMMMTNYQDYSLDNITQPDHAFASNTQIRMSATGGVGIRFNNVIGSSPLECGYRFFYLGQGTLERNNNQLTNTLATGPVYANAIMCSVII